jgi:CRP-like cAMP-binding protein
MTTYAHGSPVRTAGHRSNRLLAALDAEDFAYLEPYLEVVTLQQGQILCETDAPLTHAYFPHDTTISVAAVMEDGHMAEMMICGREGVVGLVEAVVLREAFGRYVVLMNGTASRIDYDEMQEAMWARPRIRHLVRSFAQAIFSRVLQSVACNAVHGVEARCCRWILSSYHRSEGDTVPLTHEFLAERLGVQRSTVSIAMGRLQSAGLVRQGRGGITVVDPQGLQDAACECFTRLQNTFQRLLPKTFTKR